ncbi:MAG TPA: glycosyltransferase family 39 protein [Bryobacteraceae bacterium]|nr:glycosyltransferase family 39 protein [Bryobacteraceae bacterium]
MEDRMRRYALIILLFSAAIYVPALMVPPHLMDDVDGVQAQIARNMLESGDWVTARLDGVAYLEKSPLKYWMMAASFAVFGVHDWAARLIVVASILALCWLVFAFGRWAFGELEGFYAGLVIATSIGLFLFTRILIPDVVLTATITLAMWALMRTLDEREPRPRLWAAVMAASIGIGLLLKGLIAAVFPIAAGLLWLTLTGRLFDLATWKRLRPFSGMAIALLIAAPWHVIATLRNPPYFDFSMDSGPGKYRGFFWFYFFNEHILRFLDRRWPRDYNTVPRYLFWLFHLLWFFPWSAYFPRLAKLSYRGSGRASQARMLMLCWAGFILVFFSFSTTQEYYSLPAYPAFALLLGCAVAEGSAWIRHGAKVTAAIATLAFAAIVFILANVWNLPAPGDISRALTQNPDLYTLSLGHMGDLTLHSFAYLRTPLVFAGLAFLCGALAAWRWKALKTQVGLALMMVLFLNAARVAMITFDPYLSSQPLAVALKNELVKRPGTVIFDNQYYTFSSVFFYADLQHVQLLNGRVNNLEYGSYAPGAPGVFLDDASFARLWSSGERAYLLFEKPSVERIKGIAGDAPLHLVTESGGKSLFVNRPPAEGETP